MILCHYSMFMESNFPRDTYEVWGFNQRSESFLIASCTTQDAALAVMRLMERP